jgi:hypothetical protein
MKAGEAGAPPSFRSIMGRRPERKLGRANMFYLLKLDQARDKRCQSEGAEDEDEDDEGHRGFHLNFCEAEMALEEAGQSANPPPLRPFIPDPFFLVGIATNLYRLMFLALHRWLLGILTDLMGYIRHLQLSLELSPPGCHPGRIDAQLALRSGPGFHKAFSGRETISPLIPLRDDFDEFLEAG